MIYDILGTCKQRIGSTGDGGYIIATEGLDKIEEVYSFGVAEDIMFEYDLQKRYPNIEKVHLYDPTIDFMSAPPIMPKM